MIKLDENLLAYDLLLTSHEFSNFKTNNFINNNYNSFFALNEALIYNFGKIVLLYTDTNELNKIIDKCEDKSLSKFIDRINASDKTIHDFSEGYLKILKDIDFMEVPFWDNIRRYNENDFKDIVLGYYSTFGNDIYKIVKRYFDENRIHVGCAPDSESYAGFFAGLQWIDSGYIFSVYNKYDSLSASAIVHELGHAIDAERYLFPQKKNNPIFSDILVEVPSTTFELGFNEYLRDNHIDIDGSYILDNGRLMQLKKYTEELKKSVKKEDLMVCFDGFAVDNEDNEYDFRDSLLYGIGYYSALHLNQIRRSNPEEFLKVLNNVITTRKESSFENSIREMGFSVDDYVSGKYIKDDIEDNQLYLKKRYKL